MFWHPGLENLADYPLKHHDTRHHICVRPFYLQTPTSPLFLPRAETPNQLRDQKKSRGNVLRSTKTKEKPKKKEEKITPTQELLARVFGFG